MSEVTEILAAAQRGEPPTAGRLLPLVYEELRQLAAQKLAHERPGQTLQATALVHEAYLRLVGEEERQWRNSAHFFAAASQAMRRILIDNARRKQAASHGGDWRRVNVDRLQIATEMPPDELLVVDEALERFAQVDPRAAELVRLRFYAGFSQNEVADILGVSHRMADRLWAFARAWLFAELRGRPVADPNTFCQKGSV
jgi:RNA polymerase sigma factor (TIGR02999 family)